MWFEPYFFFRYKEDGFEPPKLNCVGLSLYAIKDRAGIEIPREHVSASMLAFARGMDRAEKSPDWIKITSSCKNGKIEFVEGEQDRELDIVLFWELIGKGRKARPLGLHCGPVVLPGLVMDISEQGVFVRRYYPSPTERADGATARSVLGVYRHRFLA